MKILELTNFSAGGCGVWQRVKQESLLLSKNHDVKIFSSNFTKGSEKTASSKDKIGDIEIKRFPAKKLGGESFSKWNFEKQAIKFSPNIIIAHSYRHLHTTKALKFVKKINAKVFLVTHAPFARNKNRSFIQKLIVKSYDFFIGKNTINKFDKIIAITKWEIPYLLSLGCKKEKIVYIPNGIPKEFFIEKKQETEKKQILFMGRISKIKNLETLISSLNLIKDKKINLKIIGPAEKNYLRELKLLIKKFNLGKKIDILDKPYDKEEQINELDSSLIYVLPSISEAMPQTLIEAMARKKIVISSDNPGTKEIITNGKNGYLFKIGDEKDLTKKIDLAFSKNQNLIKRDAEKSVEKFKWEKIIRKLEKLIKDSLAQ
ncbi:MAG: glycosyltransferase family 4 protein [Candidatus Pacearchaeota archaeon]|jgi:glycosyltransferase involved in cell wall biosynthesis